MRIFLAGATGLIGTPLVKRLRERGDTAVVLTRDARKAAAALGSGVEVVEGDPQEYARWPKAVDGCQAVINLVGEPIFGKRWNDKQKQVLRDSRIVSTWNVARAIGEAGSRPTVLVNASAIGYYGNVPEGDLTEASPPGSDFLAKLCVDWEAAAREAAQHGPRVALVRIGVVLARQGGAVKLLLTPFKLGLGGPVGRGRQWVSWIHLDDIVGAFLTALDNPQASGPINGTAPAPERNKDFSRSLASALRRPAIFPVPPIAVKLRFGEVAGLVIEGSRVLPKRLEELGYTFAYTDCDSAMRAVVRSE